MGVFGGMGAGSQPGADLMDDDLMLLVDYEEEGDPMEKTRQTASVYGALNEPDDERALEMFRNSKMGSAFQGGERGWGENIGEFFLGDIMPGNRRDQEAQFRRQQAAAQQERFFVLTRERNKARKAGDDRAERMLQQQIDNEKRRRFEADRRFTREGEQYEEGQLNLQQQRGEAQRNQVLERLMGEEEARRLQQEKEDERAIEEGRYQTALTTAEEQRKERTRQFDEEMGVKKREVAAREKALAMGGTRGGRGAGYATDKIADSMRRKLRTDLDAAKARNSPSAVREVQARSQEFEAAYQGAYAAGTPEAHQEFQQRFQSGAAQPPQAAPGGGLGAKPGSAYAALQQFGAPQKAVLNAALTSARSPGEALSALSNSPIGIRTPEDMSAEDQATFESTRRAMVNEVLQTIDFNTAMSPQQKDMVRQAITAYQNNPAAADMQMVQVGEIYQMPTPPANLGTVPAQEWAMSRNFPDWGAGIIANSDFVATLGEEFRADQLEQTPTNTVQMANSAIPGTEIESGQAANLQRRGLNLIRVMTEDWREQILMAAAGDPEKLKGLVNMRYSTRLMREQDREVAALKARGPYASKPAGYGQSIVTSVAPKGVFSGMFYDQTNWAVEQPLSGMQMAEQLRLLRGQKFGWQLANAYVEAIKATSRPGVFQTYGEKVMPQMGPVMGPPMVR